MGEYRFYDEATRRDSRGGNGSFFGEIEDTKMEKTISTLLRLVRIADFFNRRIIKTSYFKSIVYFGIAVAVFLLFYFLIVLRS